MPILPTDWAQLYNWLIAGIIGGFFGFIATTITHQYTRRRDNEQWQRRLEEIEIQHQKRIDELNLQWERERGLDAAKANKEKAQEVRMALMRDIDKPDKALHDLEMLSKALSATTDSRAVRLAGSPHSKSQKRGRYLIKRPKSNRSRTYRRRNATVTYWFVFWRVGAGFLLIALIWLLVSYFLG